MSSNEKYNIGPAAGEPPFLCRRVSSSICCGCTAANVNFYRFASLMFLCVLRFTPKSPVEPADLCVSHHICRHVSDEGDDHCCQHRGGEDRLDQCHQGLHQSRMLQPTIDAFHSQQSGIAVCWISLMFLLLNVFKQCIS